jgi:eukaryotic-like serine/threonine-protein kinase
VLAHIGLARPYAMSGDTAKAKSAYQDFLALWKDADPDIPILIVTQNDRFLLDSQERFPQ